MADPIVKEIKFVVTFNPDQNNFESRLDAVPGAGPEFFWETLKLAIVQMAKVAPYYSDPVVRENVETVAKSMKLMVLGAGSAVQQAQASRVAITKELQG